MAMVRPRSQPSLVKIDCLLHGQIISSLERYICSQAAKCEDPFRSGCSLCLCATNLSVRLGTLSDRVSGLGLAMCGGTPQKIIAVSGVLSGKRQHSVATKAACFVRIVGQGEKTQPHRLSDRQAHRCCMCLCDAYLLKQKLPWPSERFLFSEMLRAYHEVVLNILKLRARKKVANVAVESCPHRGKPAGPLQGISSWPLAGSTMHCVADLFCSPFSSSSTFACTH